MQEKQTKSNSPDRQKLIAFGTMLLAIVCAVVLWFFAIDYDTPDYAKKFSKIPIDVIGEKELRETLGYTLMSQPELTVDVTLVGKRTDINKLRTSDITAVIDLSSVVEPGVNKFTVQITAPNGTTVTNPSLQEVRLYVDNFVSKEFAVSVRNMSYVLAENLYIDKVVSSPAVVTVWGPESELETISGAFVDLQLGELVNSVKATAEVKLFNDQKQEVNNPYIVLQNEIVTTSVSVYSEKEVPVRISLTGGIFSTLTANVRCDTETIKLRGSVEKMEGISEYIIEIDETDTEFDSPVKVLINPPAGVVSVSEQKYATVLISAPDVGKADFVIPAEQIKFINVKEGMVVEATEDLVINLRGLYDILEKVNPEDISVTVDMARFGNISAGTATVPVTVEIANKDIAGVFVYNKNAYSVQIDIK